MSILDPLAVLVFVVVMGLLIRWLVRSPDSSESAGDWEPFHRFEGGARRVYVRRGRELEPVGSVPSGDPAYEESFIALMDRARERASALNSER
jgi:hypothetical protein